MIVKRLIAGVLFMVLLVGLLMDFTPLSAQEGACDTCGDPVGTYEVCAGQPPGNITGQPEGDCITIVNSTKQINHPDGPVLNCTKTLFYRCPQQSGCPLGSGCSS